MTLQSKFIAILKCKKLYEIRLQSEAFRGSLSSPIIYQFTLFFGMSPHALPAFSQRWMAHFAKKWSCFGENNCTNLNLRKCFDQVSFLHCKRTQRSCCSLQQAALSAVSPPFQSAVEGHAEAVCGIWHRYAQYRAYEDFATAVIVHKRVWAWRHIDNITLPCNADGKLLFDVRVEDAALTTPYISRFPPCLRPRSPTYLAQRCSWNKKHLE